MKLEVDVREPKAIIEILKVYFPDLILKALDIGDFIIKNDDDNILVIFERKSFSDLLASIKDGRYTEQSFRLDHYPIHNHNIYYILEGDVNNFILKNNETTQKILFSSLVSLSFMKGFSVLKTNNLIETGELITRFMQKLIKEKGKSYYNSLNLNTNTNKDYSEVLKTTKKSYITIENIGEIMLSQIPGVSITVAKVIMKRYNNIPNLIQELQKSSTCLDDLKIDGKNGKRKVNTTTLKNIKIYLDPGIGLNSS